AGMEQALVGQRGLFLVPARGAAREHDAGVPAAEHALDRLGARQDLGVDAQLADPAGGEVRVLASQIQDGDLLSDFLSRHGRITSSESAGVIPSRSGRASSPLW